MGCQISGYDFGIRCVGKLEVHGNKTARWLEFRVLGLSKITGCRWNRLAQEGQIAWLAGLSQS